MSIRLLDGPGHGVTFDLRSSPTFLRVVQGPTRWDALDQAEDQPEPNETVHVYRLVEGTAGRVHVCIRGRNKGNSGWYAYGDYRHVPDAPTELLRDNARWRVWATLYHVAWTGPLPVHVVAELARVPIPVFAEAVIALGACRTDDGWTLP